MVTCWLKQVQVQRGLMASFHHTMALQAWARQGGGQLLFPFGCSGASVTSEPVLPLGQLREQEKREAHLASSKMLRNRFSRTICNKRIQLNLILLYPTSHLPKSPLPSSCSMSKMWPGGEGMCTDSLKCYQVPNMMPVTASIGTFW